MITLTEEQAQQIEEALDKADSVYEANEIHKIAVQQVQKALAAIRAARAQEQAEQEPVAWSVFNPRTGKHWYTHESKYTAELYASEYSDNALSMEVKPLYAAPVQQAEQKPIGYVIEDNDYEGSKIWAEPINGCCLPVYLAHVRTKDLTDDEINALIDKSWIEFMTIKDFARAVIAADREKNRG